MVPKHLLKLTKFATKLKTKQYGKKYLKYCYEQEELTREYERSTALMKSHPDFAEKCTKIIDSHPRFETEKKALTEALNRYRDSKELCLVWARIEKDEEFYYLKDWRLVTDDGAVKKRLTI